MQGESKMHKPIIPVEDYVRINDLPTGSFTVLGGDPKRTVMSLSEAGYSAKEAIRGAKMPNVHTPPTQRAYSDAEMYKLLHDAGYSLKEANEGMDLRSSIGHTWCPLTEEEMVKIFRQAGYGDDKIINEFNREPSLCYGQRYIPSGIDLESRCQ